MYRKYINIVEAANKGCPIATHDLEVNVKNRQTAIDKHHYGPANPEEPGSYWKDAATQWDITEKTAKTMKCGNCAAFNITDEMYKCIHDGMGKEAYQAEKKERFKKISLGPLLSYLSLRRQAAAAR